MTTTAIQKQMKAKHPPGFTEQLVLLLFTGKGRPKFVVCCVGSFISLGVPGFEEANGYKGAKVAEEVGGLLGIIGCPRKLRYSPFMLTESVTLV